MLEASAFWWSLLFSRSDAEQGMLLEALFGEGGLPVGQPQPHPAGLYARSVLEDK